MLDIRLKLQLPGISTEASQFALEAGFFVFVRKPVKGLIRSGTCQNKNTLKIKKNLTKTFKFYKNKFLT
jgi:hypothetical protein